MAGMSLVAMACIGLAIYSLSQLKETTWTRSLRELTLSPMEQRLAPEFNFSGGGRTFRSSDLRGNWTLISFWAHWCAPCLDEMPSLNEMMEAWQSTTLRVLTVNVDAPNSDSFEAARSFLTENEIRIPTIFDTEGVLKQAFQVRELPQHFLVNPEGNIVWHAIGAYKWDSPAARDELMRTMRQQIFEDGDNLADQGNDANQPNTSPTEKAPAPAAESAE